MGLFRLVRDGLAFVFDVYCSCILWFLGQIGSLGPSYSLIGLLGLNWPVSLMLDGLASFWSVFIADGQVGGNRSMFFGRYYRYLCNFLHIYISFLGTI